MIKRFGLEKYLINPPQMVEEIKKKSAFKNSTYTIE